MTVLKNSLGAGEKGQWTWSRRWTLIVKSPFVDTFFPEAKLPDFIVEYVSSMTVGMTMVIDHGSASYYC